MTSVRDPKGRDRVLIAVFAVLAIGGILLAAVFGRLLVGDERVVVATLVPDVGDAGRDRLKAECGLLPGISVVADRGDPGRQARFPVRFDIADSTPAQQSALYACLSDRPDLVRGTNVEDDGN